MSLSVGSDYINNETLALYDLGLYRDAGSRTLDLTNKHYIVMLNAGLSLNHYIKQKLNKAARFDLAIQLCWAVHSFHRGIVSRTGTAYAHRDIKPQNIVIGDHDLRLIDVGLCHSNLDHIPSALSGAQGYIPNFKAIH